MGTKPALGVVVGVDGSVQALSAVAWAAGEAAARRCPLRVVHALQWPLYHVPFGAPPGPTDAELRHAAEHVVTTAVDRAQQAAPDVHITTDLTFCSPAAALIDASPEATLLVVGHRGLGGFTGLLLGSVGVQVAAHAACPVIVVRGDPTENAAGRDEPNPTTGHVVVGVDGSDLSCLAVAFAFAHASLHRLGVVAVNAFELPTLAAPGDVWLAARDAGGWRQDQLRMVDDALAVHRDRYPDVSVQQIVRYGRPATVLLAESAGAALTVVGSRGRGGFTGLVLGSTSHGVLHGATGTVAVVHAESTAPDPDNAAVPVQRVMPDPPELVGTAEQPGWPTTAAATPPPR